MPTLLLKSATFDTFEAALNLPGITWAHQDGFDTLANGDAAGAPKVLQVSASLIRVSQAVWDTSTGVPQKVTYELRLSGTGISPVSNLDALITAINSGLAKGTLSKLEILQNGSSILTLGLDGAGYHLTSGDVTVNLTGKLPLSFTQFGDIAGLFDQIANIDQLSRPDRAALFSDLTAYAVTGLTLADGGHVLFAAHVSATVASLTLNGLTLTATGHFPANLGEDIEALWNMLGSGQPLHVTGFDGLAITALTLTDADGHVVGSMADPLADTPLLTRVNGKLYDDVQMGDNADNSLSGLATDRQMLAGLGGRDLLAGGILSDYLMGGSGNDTLSGFRGADRLDGGQGRDLLTGGLGADVFHFALGGGTDRITDFQVREDVIQILDAVRKADLTFTQVGDDVQIDYRSIHILVDHSTVAQMDHAFNFLF